MSNGPQLDQNLRQTQQLSVQQLQYLLVYGIHTILL